MIELWRDSAMLIPGQRCPNSGPCCSWAGLYVFKHGMDANHGDIL